MSLIFSSCSKEDDPVTPGTTGTETEQQLVFQEFWDIYDKYYPLFPNKDINWQTIHDTYYPQITASTTDAQLLEIFRDIMQNSLKDGHTSLTYNNSDEAGFSPPFNEQNLKMIEMVDGKINYLRSSENNPFISYGTLIANQNIGYIKSKVFEPMTNDPEAEFTSFKNTVNEALTTLQNTEGIIVDVRTNGGGAGPLAFYLAGRFVDPNKTLAGEPAGRIARGRVKISKGSMANALGDWLTSEYEGVSEPRAEDGGRFGSWFAEEFKLQPTGSFQYNNRVALLTSEFTASAAEYFTSALKTQTHVKSFGTKTFGIFGGSEILKLNNGAGKWVTRLTAQDIEVLHHGNYQSFEGLGIPPDVALIPTAEQVNSGKDIQMDAAVEYILN